MLFSQQSTTHHEALQFDRPPVAQANAWDHLFASSWRGELAAAKLCEGASKLLKKNGEDNLANNYSEIARQEYYHAKLVLGLVEGTPHIGPRAASIYDDVHITHENLVERLSVLHVVFEPSAIANFGFIHDHCDRLFGPAKAKKVHRAMGIILRDEVEHIDDGVHLLRYWQKRFPLTAELKRFVSRSLRKHRVFLRRGIVQILGQSCLSRRDQKTMLDNFDTHFSRTLAGVF